MSNSAAPVTREKTIQSTLTGSLSPEDVLERFDEFDIDWHLTDEGALWIKYWQIGAEGFVPPPRVAELRQQRPVPTGAQALEWVSRHLSALQRTHAGQWIAVAGDRVATAANTLPDLMAALEELDLDEPFITQIPAGPLVWNTAYRG